MSDRYTLQLKNFRSIRDAEIDIAPLTVVYGPNGSGKSSLIYGLLTLKNFLTDPNRNLPSLFLYPGIGLGGFDEVVFNHQSDEVVSISLATSQASASDSDSMTEINKSKFSMEIAQSGGKSSVYLEGPPLVDPLIMDLDIPYPYQGNQSAYGEGVIGRGNEESGPLVIHLEWNGMNLNPGRIRGKFLRESAVELMKWASTPMALARRVYFVPLRRGFASPSFSVTNVTPWLETDREVASMLASDRFLEYRVSDYMETVADRQIRARMRIGSSSFTIDSVPRNRETPVSIVNEGFGVNQLAYLLTIALYDEAKIVLIEEPEVHLHPSMVRKLVHAMVDITSNHDRRFVISTHSETFVVSLLSQIAAGKISVDDVSFVLADKNDGESEFTRQEAKANGQIQGGLDSFIASELEDIAAFLGLSSEED